MIITVGGPPGSGTSTAAELVSQHLGMRVVSAGEMFRGMARERGLSLAELGALAEAQWDVDHQLDERMVAVAEAHGDVVLEGRLIGLLLARRGVEAFSVHLAADPQVRAGRIALREHKDPAEALREIQQRERSEAVRYKDIYGIDILDTEPYDLVLDSSTMTARQVADAILGALHRH